MNVKEEIDLERLRKLEPKELLKEVFDRFGERASIGTSFQKTGTVIVDLTSRVVDDFRVYFIDTLRHPPETYKFIGQIEEKYDIDVEIYKPDEEELERLLEDQGQHGHLFSVQERKRCCQVRKTNPAQRVEKDLTATISGLRADQSSHREGNFRRVFWQPREDNQPLLKVNPLFKWTEEDLDDYIEEENLDTHPLYDYRSEQGEVYKVIGCETCHFPIQEDRDKRAGKFPWEKSEKECGLHYTDGGGI